MAASAAPVPAAVIARLLSLPERSVAATLALLDEGNTVPFLARYRKEATGGLDEVQIRDVAERAAYLADLGKRRAAILASIEEQGKLTPELAARLAACTTKAELEDLYLPFKPKRRTRATMARERGLEPLARRILEQPERGDPAAEAARFADAEKGVPDAEAALAGARDIVAEAVSENADVRAVVRAAYRETGLLRSEAIKAKTKEPTRFEAYYDFAEPVARIPSHRYLAVRRGEREGVLRVRVEVDAERVLPQVRGLMRYRPRTPFGPALAEAVEDGFTRLLAPSVENEVDGEARERAERDAVEVFADNLGELLLAPPAGPRPVVGVDPGLRTGCKCAAVDATGRFAGFVAVYPHTEGEGGKAARTFAEFVRKHRPFAVAVGNGTAGRETEAFARQALADAGLKDVVVVMVSEAGASVYSASDLARQEFPDQDVTVRGAISIARRLQDPLAELVKVDPRSIGVGQYQHDLPEAMLARRLDEVVETCVNRVGVDLNTASAPLLGYVAGIGPVTAKRVVAWREAHGTFPDRGKLLEVAGIGPKTFLQCAGFLRIRGGRQPLDASAVHPERYPLVERMARDLKVPVADLVGKAPLVDRIDPKRYAGDGVGEPTLRDILDELRRPGRDPRATFEPPRFRDDVRTIEDLKPGMELEGVVTNVAAFGAFVDIGVHQDGLVHVSELSDRYVRDPREVARTGQRLKVKVLNVDVARKRISLTAKG